MTNTAVFPQISWEALQDMLPLIQVKPTAESIRPPFFNRLEIEYDVETRRWIAVQIPFIGPKQQRAFNDIHDLEKRLIAHVTSYYQSTLDAAVRAFSHEALLVVAKQIPYPQDCICQDADAGLMADDCHVHNDFPKHFFGDFEFDCTCV